MNQKQQNIPRRKKTRSGKRNSIVASRDARIPLALLCGDEVPCFLLTLRLLYAIRRACPHLALGSFLTCPVKARGRGLPNVFCSFPERRARVSCSGSSVCPSEGHQMSTEFRGGLGCVCDVVLWSRTKGKRGRECKVAPSLYCLI